MNDQTKKKIYRVMLLGDESVGKTSFLYRLAYNKFEQNHVATIGIDYRTKEMQNKQGENLIVQIWDTGGAERFHSLTKSYYKGAHGMMVLFDVSSTKSFEHMKEWVTSVKDNSPNYVTIYMVAAKIDLKEERCISQSMGQKLANELEVKYFETSAKENINIIETFEAIVLDIDNNKNVQRSIVPVKRENKFTKLKNAKREEENKKNSNCC